MFQTAFLQRAQGIRKPNTYVEFNNFFEQSSKPFNKNIHEDINNDVINDSYIAHVLIPLEKHLPTVLMVMNFLLLISFLAITTILATKVCKSMKI